MKKLKKNYGNFILIACAESHQSESSWLYKYLIQVRMRGQIQQRLLVPGKQNICRKALDVWFLPSNILHQLVHSTRDETWNVYERQVGVEIC